VPGKLGWLQGCFLGIWAILPILFIVWLAATHKSPLDSNAKKLGPLKIYIRATEYAEVDRAEAVKFSLDKEVTVVNYLLLVTAAVLAFVVKSILDIRTELSKTVSATTSTPLLSLIPKRWQLLLFMHGGIACFISIFCGVAAYLYFPAIATYESFSVGNEIGICMKMQLLFLLIGILLLIGALIGFIRNLLP
jgi:hypothetical protein